MSWLARDVYRRRNRGVWFALGAGVFGVVGVLVVVLLPVLALVGSSASFAPVIAIPYGRITLVIVGGYALALGLLALAGLSKYGALSWIAAIAAVTSSLIVSVYPLFAVAFTAVDTAGDVIPWILDLINDVRAGI
ncbi:hypothetical protein [Marisediminicola senii]|uniref:hypothetical protein n=1 Tax=Marisediminicola senii TaxID=2711233 RepID=UPI0013EC191A|nr:hypothetical protein [Marisediminicola senii]